MDPESRETVGVRPLCLGEAVPTELALQLPQIAAVMTRTTYRFIDEAGDLRQVLPRQRSALQQLWDPPRHLHALAAAAIQSARAFVAECGHVSIDEIRLHRQRLAALLVRLQRESEAVGELCVANEVSADPAVDEALSVARCLERPFSAWCVRGEGDDMDSVLVRVCLAGHDESTQELTRLLVQRTVGGGLAAVRICVFSGGRVLVDHLEEWPFSDVNLCARAPRGEAKSVVLNVVVQAGARHLFSAQFAESRA